MACGDDGRDSSALLAAPSDGEGEQHVIRGRVAPGSEATYCQRVALRGGRIDVARIEHAYGGRSHHFFVYESFAPPSAAGPVFACDDAHDLDKSALLYATQQRRDELTYPSGVAVEVKEDRTLLLEWHVVNTGDTPADAEAALNLWYAPEPPTAHAGMLVYYDPFIHVPPFASASARMHCRLPEDVTLLWTSSHMHARGVGHRSQVTRRDGETTELSSTTDWETPGIEWLPNELDLAAGDAIDFVCDYDNPTNRNIIEGPTAGDHEMCMFFAGYYPRMHTEGGEACSGAESGPVFDGTATCEESFACLAQAQSEVESERCWVAASEGATKPLLDLAYRCRLSQCGGECTDSSFSPNCAACLSTRCSDERARCLAPSD
jgi:hypothetical protein